MKAPFSSLSQCVSALILGTFASEQHPFQSLPSLSGSHATLDLNFSSPYPHVFFSLHNLLQQWPQTYFPNGFAITPGTIPSFTKLYHGRADAEQPPSPEWLALDIEMSYGIMGSTRNSHMLTYQTTRPIKVLYFDGESAALWGDGQLHTQMLHIYGNVTGSQGGAGFRGLWDEYARANGLCNWIKEKELGGRGWGVEGIVRMNTGFELIWCDFTSPSLRLISHLNVTAPMLDTAEEAGEEDEEEEEEGMSDGKFGSYAPLPPLPSKTDRSSPPTDPPLPPNWRKDILREPFLKAQGWGWFTSATKHYGSSGEANGVGESRVKLHTCGMLTYYAPEFQSQAIVRAGEEQKRLNLSSTGSWLSFDSSEFNATWSRQLALQQLTRRRRKHVLSATSTEDAYNMRRVNEDVLRSFVNDNLAQCSGADWQSIAMEIVAQYANPLYRLNSMFSATPSEDDDNEETKAWFKKVRNQMHDILVPFLEYPQTDDLHDSETWNPGSATYRETLVRCRYHHTRLLVPEEDIELQAAERLLRNSVEEVMNAICSSVVDIGLSVELIWMQKYQKPFSKTVHVHEGVHGKEIRRWRKMNEELMAWLGWASEWTRCEQKCAWDEVCYIPMWPFNMRARTRPSIADAHGRPPPHEPPYERPRPPSYGRPGRSDWVENDLWQPKCIAMDYIMA